jgi:hypothetical protein
MHANTKFWPDIRVGDVYFVMGKGAMTRSELKKIQRTAWFKKLRNDEKRVYALPEEILARAYSECLMSNGREPAWIKHVSPGLCYALRALWLMGEDFDPLAILPYRHDLGFSFAVHDGGLIHEVCIALGVFRLDGIRQLGFLHDPVVNEPEQKVKGLGFLFGHTRYMHSLTVMATASLIGHKVGLTEYELRHLQVAALTHDVLTPAGGDTTKFIDPDAFDEDAHYPEIFLRNPEWDQVREKYGLDSELLCRTVRGEGVLGALLDIADKTSYVAHDLDAFLLENDPRRFRYLNAPHGMTAVWDYRNSLTYPGCALWGSIRVDGDRIVITEPEKLKNFVMLRALMFRHLYYNPYARYREQMLAVLVLEPLYREGILTRNMLLTMGDTELERIVNAEVRVRDLSWELCLTDVAPRVLSFATVAQAKNYARTLVANDPFALVMWETFPPVSEKALRFLVQDASGAVRVFKEVCPEDAENILALGRDENPVKLYVLERGDIEGLMPEMLHKKLRTQQEERLRSDV